MPLSRRRKKKGKAVGNNAASRKSRIDENSYANQPTAVTLQDLINVVAYQEYVKDGTIVAEDAKITVADDAIVTVEDADGNKRQVGTAHAIPGDSAHVSLHITDPETQKIVQGPIGNYSIDEENQDDV